MKQKDRNKHLFVHCFRHNPPLRFWSPCQKWRSSSFRYINSSFSRLGLFLKMFSLTACLFPFHTPPRPFPFLAFTSPFFFFLLHITYMLWVKLENVTAFFLSLSSLSFFLSFIRSTCGHDSGHPVTVFYPSGRARPQKPNSPQTQHLNLRGEKKKSRRQKDRLHFCKHSGDLLHQAFSHLTWLVRTPAWLSASQHDRVLRWSRKIILIQFYNQWGWVYMRRIYNSSAPIFALI